jgi:hypothetical protein
MNDAQKKAAAAFDNTKTAASIGLAKKAIGIILIGIVGYWAWWTVGNAESSATAYHLTNVWVQDDDYRDLVPMIRNAMDDGVLSRIEWWRIGARQEKIAQTKHREELLKTVTTNLP